MATPGELVEVLADVLGISPTSVAQYDRVLAENGLRSKSGRGTSAAKVTAIDAANLLLAVVASPLAGMPVREAVQTCTTYGSLIELEKGSWRENFPRLGLPSMGALPPGHSFRDALATLIDGASRKEFFKIPVAGERPITKADAFDIEFDGPRPWAHIFANGLIGEPDPNEMARFVYVHPEEVKRFKKGPKGDLHQTRHISFATVRRLGCLLASSDSKISSPSFPRARQK
jgi:hypothetical protein